MTRSAATPARWLRRPATTFGGRFFLYVPLFFAGPVGLVASLWYLVSGHVHGGRPAAAVLVGYTALCGGVWLAAVRPAGRIAHLVAATALLPGLDVVDVWVTDGRLGGRFPGYVLLLAAGLLLNLVRYARRERAGDGTDAAEGAAPPLVAPAADAG